MELTGFWEVVGFEPYEYNGLLLSTATFGTEKSAQKFAAERGGEVKHRKADGVIVEGKIIPVE